MYDKFTDRSRKVMQLANQEAQRFNHDHIGTEHILLALVKEGSGAAANALKNLDIDLRKIRLETEKLIKSGPNLIPPGKLPLTPNAKQVIQVFAINWAKQLGHNYVGTGHLLLGLLRVSDGVACKVLMALGVELFQVRDVVLELLTPESQDAEAQVKHVKQMCDAQMRHLKACFDAAIAQIKEAGEQEVARLNTEHLQQMADKNAQLSEPAVEVRVSRCAFIEDGGKYLGRCEIAQRYLMNFGVQVLERIFELGCRNGRRLAWHRLGADEKVFHVTYTDGDDWVARDKVMSAFNEFWQLKDVTEEQKNAKQTLAQQEMTDPGEVVIDVGNLPAEDAHAVYEHMKQLHVCQLCGSRHSDGDLTLDGKKVCGTCFNCEPTQEQSWRSRPSML